MISTRAVALAVLAAGLTPGSPAQAAAPLRGAGAADAVPGRYIVVLKRGASSADKERTKRGARDRGATIGHDYARVLDGYAAKLTPAALARVRADPAVAYVEADAVVRATTTQTGATWGLDRIDQRNLPPDAGYSYTADGSGVKAYVIDTGVRLTHADFGGRAVTGFDAVTAGGTANDCHGHGTHVAGSAGGTTYGVAKQVAIVAVRVLDCAGAGTTSGVIAGVDWVTGDHLAGQPAVANMSLGGGPSLALDTAVNNSIADGVSYAVAAGNNNSDACSASPARVPSAITVGATTTTDARASFSNYGPCLDLFAPGESITSSWYTSNTATNTISGTSMASPHVAGVAALYLEANPSAAPAVVATAITTSATTGKVASPGTGSANRLLYAFVLPPSYPGPVVKNVVSLPPGGSAGRIAIDRNDDRVYVANGANAVHVYSADLATAYPDIATGVGAFAVAIDQRPGSRRLFVGLYPGTVEVFNLPSGTPSCAPFGGTGAGINSIAFDPVTAKAFIAVESAPSIAIANGPLNCSVTTNVTTHDKPLDIALDRTAGRVYAPIHHADELAVMTTAGVLAPYIPVLAGNPFGVAADHINHRVYVAENLGNRIVAVNSGPAGVGPYTQTNLTLGDAPASVEVDPDLDTAYVGIRNFLALGVVTHDIPQSPIALGLIPGKPAVNPNTHCIYVSGPSGPVNKLARLCHAFSTMVAADSPAAWYSLGEGTGTTLVPTAGGQAGYYQNGVVLGQPGAIAGEAGSSALFNGTSSHAYVNGIAAPTQAYTMEAWMKPGAPLQGGTLIDHGSAGALYMTASAICLRQTATHVCSSATISTADWTHVAGTWDAISGVARLYVDGVEVASADAQMSPSGNGTLFIGYGQSASWFKGLLDEVAYYPTDLSATSIALHYHAGCGC
jgi:subtilisin family serine protease